MTMQTAPAAEDRSSEQRSGAKSAGDGVAHRRCSLITGLPGHRRNGPASQWFPI